jgi:hypothetical protein
MESHKQDNLEAPVVVVQIAEVITIPAALVSQDKEMLEQVLIMGLMAPVVVVGLEQQQQLALVEAEYLIP